MNAWVAVVLSAYEIDEIVHALEVVAKDRRHLIEVARAWTGVGSNEADSFYTQVANDATKLAQRLRQALKKQGKVQ